MSAVASEKQAGARRTAAALVAAAKQRVKGLDVEGFAREVGAGTLVVDLRETEERTTLGAIPGALHVPRGMLEFLADPDSPKHRAELDPARRIALYCAAGSRSALAAATLLDLGYSSVVHLDGGFAAWSAAGRPVDGGSATSSV